jgi:hypothetical protein
MFNILSLFKTKEKTVLAPVVAPEPPKHVEVPTTEPSISKPKNRPTPKLTYMEFKSWLWDHVCRGVVISTSEARGYDDSTSVINILLVTHRNGERIEPYIDWVNEYFCTEIKPYSVSHIDVKDFNKKNWDLIKGIRIKS